MFAENWFASASHLGWAGVLAFFAVLIGHLAVTRYGAQWIFGPAPSRGGLAVVC